jgi:6-phosphogluconolactonase
MKLTRTFAWTGLVAAGVLLHVSVMCAAAVAAERQVYIGTYTGGKSRGIYTARFDAESGRLSAPELAAPATNPSFLALHPNGHFLYAVGEMDTFEGKRAGAVSAFRIETGGKLSPLNSQGSGGTGPCHLSVDQSGHWVLVANYGSGSVAALPAGEDGRLGAVSVAIQHHGSSVNPQRQAGPHAHFIASDPWNRFALACDLGLDKVLVYRLNQSGAVLTANEPPSVSVQAGAGPRHLAFHPNRQHVYLANEMASTMTVFEYMAKAVALKELRTVSLLPEGFKGQSTAAEVQVHPSGKFVYASNRGHDSIAVFAVEPKDGRLKFVQHQSSGGRTPRHFVVDPTGHWLLVENQDSDNIVAFRIAEQTGQLNPPGQVVEVGSPVCLVFGGK